jgi:hypothetical protein
MPAGRPTIYSNPDEMCAIIDCYFDNCKNDGEHPTICGLALACGFDSRSTIYEYEKKPEFSYMIKRAMLKIENTYEKRACSSIPTGPIFVLKNMGWKDKTEHDISGGLQVKRMELPAKVDVGSPLDL